MPTTHTTELAARRHMADLKARGIQFSYWHRSVCEHIVTVH